MLPRTIVIDARIINSSTGRYIERLLHHLEQLDAQNTYLILVPSKDMGYYKPLNPNFKMVAADFANYSLGEQLGFKTFLDRLKPDLVHFCMPQQPIRYKGLHVTTVHDLILLNTYNSDKNWFIFRAKQLVGRFVFKAIGKNSASIITPTKYVKEAYAQFAGISPGKIAVTYEGCDTTASVPKTYEPLVGEEFILYVGQQSDYKNIKRLMQAHQQLRKTHPTLLLVLIGRLGGTNGKPLVLNKEWAEARGYKGIVYTDFLPDEQLLWCMQQARAYVFASLMEGFGLPALEAMAAGAPLVSSNATCLPEVYGDAAEYFNPLSVDDMSAAIERVISDPVRRNALIKKGAVQSAKYSWRTMAEQTYQIYQDALKSSKTD